MTDWTRRGLPTTMTTPALLPSVQRVADTGLSQAERPRSRGGFRAHAAESISGADPREHGPDLVN